MSSVQVLVQAQSCCAIQVADDSAVGGLLEQAQVVHAFVPSRVATGGCDQIEPSRGDEADDAFQVGRIQLEERRRQSNPGTCLRGVRGRGRIDRSLQSSARCERFALRSVAGDRDGPVSEELIDRMGSVELVVVEVGPPGDDPTGRHGSVDDVTGGFGELGGDQPAHRRPVGEHRSPVRCRSPQWLRGGNQAGLAAPLARPNPCPRRRMRPRRSRGPTVRPKQGCNRAEWGRSRVPGWGTERMKACTRDCEGAGLRSSHPVPPRSTECRSGAIH